jgi:hypothetical protein
MPIEREHPVRTLVNRLQRGQLVGAEAGGKRNAALSESESGCQCTSVCAVRVDGISRASAPL